MQSDNLGKVIFGSYSKHLFLFVLVSLSTSILSTSTKTNGVSVKEEFTIPKDIVVYFINEYFKSLAKDYVPSLSKQIGTIAESPFKPTMAEKEFKFFSNNDKTAVDLVKEAAGNSAGSDDAISKLVQVEDFTSEIQNYMLPAGKVTIFTLYNFIREFKFVDGSFCQSGGNDFRYEFEWTKFIDYMTVYVPDEGVDDVMSKVIAEKTGELKQTELRKTFIINLFMAFCKPGEGTEISLTDLINKLCTVRIDINKIQIKDTGDDSMELLSKETIISIIGTGIPRHKIYVPFIANPTLNAYSNFSVISMFLDCTNAEEQLKKIFADLDTVLRDYAVFRTQETNSKRISSDDFNRIFNDAFSPLPTITEADVPDDLCNIGDLPYNPALSDEDVECFSVYFDYLKETGKIVIDKSNPVSSFASILVSNKDGFKADLEKKAIEMNKTVEAKKISDVKKADNAKNIAGVKIVAKDKKPPKRAAKVSQAVANSMPSLKNKQQIVRSTKKTTAKNYLSPVAITFYVIGGGGVIGVITGIVIYQVKKRKKSKF